MEMGGQGVFKREEMQSVLFMICLVSFLDIEWEEEIVEFQIQGQYRVIEFIGIEREIKICSFFVLSSLWVFGDCLVELKVGIK